MTNDIEAIGHEHIWTGVGTIDVSIAEARPEAEPVTDDPPAPPRRVVRCIIRACICLEWYLQPLDKGGDATLRDVIRPWPDWAEQTEAR